MRNIFSFMNQRSKKIAGLLAVLLMPAFMHPIWAAGPPGESIWSNSLAVIMFILMIILMIIIAVLGNILIGLADMKVKKQKAESTAGMAVSILLILILSNTSLFAQNTGEPLNTTAKTIGGMSATTFYLMVAVIFVELATILALLVNIKFILYKGKENATAPEIQEKAIEVKKSNLSWWDRFNKLRPVEQEADLDLGHDYDGIRELNNKLPPWWLYGFYASIVFAVVYLWQHHVSHTAPLSAQEYEQSVQLAELRVSNFLKAKGENINENTVVLLTDKENLEAGKELFTNGACIGCHGKDGSGMVMGQLGVGPNLTDDYWINGGSIKKIFSTIKYGGRSGKGMQAWENTYSAKQINQIASYVKSLKGTNPLAHKPPDGELYKEEDPVPVTTAKPITDSLKSKPNDQK